MHGASAITDGAWRGRTVILLGGGAGLRGLDLEALNAAHRDGRIVLLASNKRARDCPDAYAITFDRQFARDEQQDPLPNPIKIHCVREGDCFQPVGWARVPVKHRREGNTWAPYPATLAEGVVTAGNTGCGALCLADLLCAGEGAIYLCGYDMAPDPDNPDTAQAEVYERWRGALEGYRPSIRTPAYVVGASSLSDAWQRRELPDRAWYAQAVQA